MFCFLFFCYHPCCVVGGCCCGSYILHKMSKLKLVHSNISGNINTHIYIQELIEIAVINAKSKYMVILIAHEKKSNNVVFMTSPVGAEVKQGKTSPVFYEPLASNKKLVPQPFVPKSYLTRLGSTPPKMEQTISQKQM